jgi:hypothetical protein
MTGQRSTILLRTASGILLGLACTGCATMGQRGESLVPTRYETRTGPFAVYSNYPIAADSPAIRSLHTLETDIEASLGVRVSAEEPAVEVYVLRDREAFTHFLKFHYPELPPRRAFFLARGSKRVVYTFQGERLEEDLRHEATHALLNVAIGDLPLWLDEGLAEYFEGSDEHQGLNHEHLERLPRDLASGWSPDLAKLEALQNVSQMTPRDYRESWAWIHYFLNGSDTGRAVLLAYLADLHTTPSAPPLSERLQGGPAPASKLLVTHVERLGTTQTATLPSQPASAVATTVRLQDPAPAAAPPPPPRRSLLARLRSWVGL